MPLPRVVAATVCAAVLGAQLWASFPVSREGSGWYWPFLPYPMYSIAHSRGDSLIDNELRVAECGRTNVTTALSSSELGVSLPRLHLLLAEVGRRPGSAVSRRASARLSRAIDAQFPGRYCAASAWQRVVRVADEATHRVTGPMLMVATWSTNTNAVP